VELITIRTFQNYFTAHILLTKLRSAGIECYLRDEFTVTVDPFLSNAVGGIKLVVKKDMEYRASKMLQQFDEDYRQSAVCPKCGSKTIELVPVRTTKNLLTALLTWIFGNYAISAKNIYQCSTCKYESETLPENLHSDLLILEKESLN
jgi:DNA-directed RNA polymerase subunit RPC12/RpoP